MFEHHHQPLAIHRNYIARRLRSLAAAACILLPSLGLGVLGYHLFGKLQWIDALLNASMILTGMGPVDTMQSVAGKLFASCYALFSGIVFITRPSGSGFRALNRYVCAAAGRAAVHCH